MFAQKMRVPLVVALVVFAFDIAPARLEAAIIYTNLGGATTFTGAYTAENATAPFSDGTEFTASVSGVLGQILTPIADALLSMTFDLYTDSSGQPGILLEEWTNVPVPSSNLTSIPLLTLTSVVNPTLSAGNVYWFVATSQATSDGSAIRASSAESGAATPARRSSNFFQTNLRPRSKLTRFPNRPHGCCSRAGLP